MKNRFFKIILIIIGVAALLTVFIVARNYYDAWRQSKLPGFQIQKIYEEAAKNDIWGGKTPQETYEMFVAALKNGDIDLASKYFAGLEGKAKAKKWLTEKQEKGELEKYISELPKWEEMKESQSSDENEKNFSWEYIRDKEETYYDRESDRTITLYPGKYQDNAIFYFSLPNKIWKIDEI